MQYTLCSICSAYLDAFLNTELQMIGSNLLGL